MNNIEYSGRIQNKSFQELYRINQLNMKSFFIACLVFSSLILVYNSHGKFEVFNIYLDTLNFVKQYWYWIILWSMFASLVLHSIILIFPEIITIIGNKLMKNLTIEFEDSRAIVSKKYYYDYHQVISIENYPYLIVLITKSKDKNGWRSRLTSKLYLSKSNFINTTPEAFIAFMKEKNPSIQVITPNPWWMRLLRKMGKY